MTGWLPDQSYRQRRVEAQGLSQLSQPAAAEEVELSTVCVFPGLGGGDQELAAMRAACGSAVRFVIVEYPDWTDIYRRSIDLDGLIAICMERVRAAAPHGGLRLAGYSFGGSMAYAVAKAFLASGRDVARLGLVDSWAFPGVVNDRPTVARRWKRVTTSVRKRELHREIGRLTAGLIMRSRSPLLLRWAARMRQVRLPLDMHEHLAHPFQARFRLALLRELTDRMAVDDERLDVQTVLFRCAEQDQADAAPDLGWERHIKSVRVIVVPGHHSTVINPANLQFLCEAFVASMVDDSGVPVVGYP
jgi:thioesterase domain-containing protein